MQVLTIAAGTPYAVDVFDVRRGQLWALSTGRRASGPPAALWWHHTCGPAVETAPPRQVNAMLRMARTSEHGLPYNFIVWPTEGTPAYYLNDVDLCWPHTYGHNCDVAVAAEGNYETTEPPSAMVSKLMRLADALATMWNVTLPTYGHRDCYPTACPGKYLYPLLAGY